MMWGTRRRARYLIGAIVTYALIACAGVSALLSPSPALVQQGGMLLTGVWAVLCLIGAVVGVFGVWTARILPDLIGSGIAASACFVWGASLVLQAVDVEVSGTPPYTAACAAAALATVFTQHCVNLVRAPRE